MINLSSHELWMMDNENDPMDDIEAKNFILFRNLQVLVQYQKDTRRERFCPIFDIFRYFGTQYPFQFIILDKLSNHLQHLAHPEGHPQI